MLDDGISNIYHDIFGLDQKEDKTNNPSKIRKSQDVLVA